MTDKDVKRLRRVELLEMLIDQIEENEKLNKRIRELEAELSHRTITLEHAGSIAEAAIGLSKVFEEAQSAADRYLESIQARESTLTELEKKTERECRAKLLAAEQQAEKIRTEAQLGAPVYEPVEPAPQQDTKLRRHLFGRK